MPGDNVLPFAGPEAAVTKRAGFMTRHLWVTRHDPRERYAAGEYPNQHPGGAGLPTYVQDDAPLENTDVVVWYTFGSHHIVRPEDWPVMPVMPIGFKLKPVGFFDRNPGLDVPAPAVHCGCLAVRRWWMCPWARPPCGPATCTRTTTRPWGSPWWAARTRAD